MEGPARLKFIIGPSLLLLLLLHFDLGASSIFRARDSDEINKTVLQLWSLPTEMLDKFSYRS